MADTPLPHAVASAALRAVAEDMGLRPFEDMTDEQRTEFTLRYAAMIRAWGQVSCGECAALVQPGDMPAHARWHDGFADRVRKIILDEGRRSMTGLRIPRTGIGDGI